MAQQIAIRHVGFTGTRQGMTNLQLATVMDVLADLVGDYFHHGCCVGADEEAAAAARLLQFWTVGHPPIDRKLLSSFEDDDVWEPKDYLARNRDIVDVSEVMIAAPNTLREQRRSGTWSTIRYARKTGTELHIVLPTGEMVTHA